MVGHDNVMRDMAYKDGFIYAGGDRIVYGAGYANVWKINAETGVVVDSLDVGAFDLAGVILLGSGRFVALRNAATTMFTEFDDDLNIIRVVDRDDTPLSNWTLLRGEAVPEAVLYPGPPTENTIIITATGASQTVAVIPGDGEDQVWVGVLRTLNGEQVRCIECMKPRVFATQADCFFVDCGLFYDLETPSTTLTGLDHLEGETVAILGDGAVYPNQIVADGQIVLAQAVSKAAVGLPYRYTLKPMRIDMNTAKGSSHGSYKKIAELVISFLNTLDAKYGADLDHLYDIDWRTTEPYGAPPVLFTGDKVVTLDGGFDPEAPIVISGEEPLPCCVRAIVARLEVPGR
jgi:hypothetical protein